MLDILLEQSYSINCIGLYVFICTFKIDSKLNFKYSKSICPNLSLSNLSKLITNKSVCFFRSICFSNLFSISANESNDKIFILLPQHKNFFSVLFGVPNSKLILFTNVEKIFFSIKFVSVKLILEYLIFKFEANKLLLAKFASNNIYLLKLYL